MKHNLLRLSMLLLLLGMSLSYVMAQGPAKAGSQGYVDPPATGNAQADEEAHIKAKTQWIKDNPEAYRQAGGDPESVLKPANTELPNQSKPHSPIALPKFEIQQSFRFVSIKVQPLPNKKVSQTEIADLEASLNHDLFDQSTLLQYGPQGLMRIYVPGNKDVRGIETKKGNSLEWYFENKECESCSKSLKLEVLKDSADEKVLLMEDEDEDSRFAFRITFKSDN